MSLTRVYIKKPKNVKFSIFKFAGNLPAGPVEFRTQHWSIGVQRSIHLTTV